MKTKAIHKAALALLAALVVLTAVSCDNGGDSQKTMPPHNDCPEAAEGWSVYYDPESSLSFCYPSEWGEVIDYVDYFKALILAETEVTGLFEEEEEAMEVWEPMVRDSGRFLAFSNLDMVWGAHVRITSAEKMALFITEAVESYTSREIEAGTSGPWLGPLLGYIGGLLVSTPDYYTLHPDFELPDYEAELPELVQIIADLPENASAEELQEAVLPLSLLFTNGLRSPDLAETTYGQLATDDGALSGVTEAGVEGFDVGVRDYWDCILTDAEGNRFVYLSFTLSSLSDDEQTRFAQFAATIILAD